MARIGGENFRTKIMNVAITGTTGFLGQNLISYLNNEEILKISRQQLNNIQAENLGNCQAIIHLAGKAHDLKKTSTPQQYYHINFELTKKLYDVFLQSDAKKFIFISSVKAAADTFNGVLTEEVLPNPTTDYGKSKLMAEQYLQSKPLPLGKSYYILRPCMVYGPGNKGNLNLLYRLVKKNIPYPLASFENKRSFLSVENLCFVIKQLLEKEIESGIYQIADSQTLSTNEIISILAGGQTKSPKMWKIPKRLIGLLAKLGDKINLPLNSERLQKLTENYVVSNQKILQAIGLPLPVSSEEGLYKTIKLFDK